MLLAQTGYFSHFGEVTMPKVPDRELLSIASDLDGVRFRPLRLPPELDWSIIGQRDSVRAVAGFRRGLADQAVLVVYCQPSWQDCVEWCEAGVVSWPLQFVGPAQVAGSCCAPRYGLL